MGNWIPLEQVEHMRTFIRMQGAKIEELQNEIERLRKGDFTEEEFQNLCPNMDGDRFENFCNGCDLYQRKLFGKCRTDELRDELAEQLKRVSNPYFRP